MRGREMVGLQKILEIISMDSKSLGFTKEMVGLQ